VKIALVLSMLLGLASSSVVAAGAPGHVHEAEEGKAAMHDEGDRRHGEKKSDDHEGKDHGHGHDQEVVSPDAELSDVQRKTAGIETLLVKNRSLGSAITAPGEVILNAYRTTKVTPRIVAQVLKRHVRLGDHVKKDQPLVTLSSVVMAEAQGALLEAETERRRVERLGRNVVSEKRYITAQIAYQQAYAKVRAYGMTTVQTDRLIKQGDATKATGVFSLLSSQDGTVISDAFLVGEIIQPGHVLLEISDESALWVEARLTPEDAAGIAIGAAARVKAGGAPWLPGKVVQARHTLDETTRTLAVRIEAANPGDALHPGQFVTAVIEGQDKRQGIVVPLAAVLRAADGDWQVFVETAPGRFEPKEVKVLRTVGDQMLIQGIEEGTTIVSKGAFFVQSEIAKSGFEVHNH